MEEGEKKASSVSSSERAREKWRKLLAGVNRINIEATTAATSGYTFSSPASAANDEVAVLHVNQACISTGEAIFEIQVVVSSAGTSPDTQYYSCTDAEQDNDRVCCRRNSSTRSISMESNDFGSVDVQQGNAGNGNRDPCCRRDGSKQK